MGWRPCGLGAITMAISHPADPLICCRDERGAPRAPKAPDEVLTSLSATYGIKKKKKTPRAQSEDGCSSWSTHKLESFIARWEMWLHEISDSEVRRESDACNENRLRNIERRDALFTVLHKGCTVLLFYSNHEGHNINKWYLSIKYSIQYFVHNSSYLVHIVALYCLLYFWLDAKLHFVALYICNDTKVDLLSLNYWNEMI